MRYVRLAVVGLGLAVASLALHAQTQPQPAASGYLLPPKAIVDILDAPPPPTAELSPARDTIVLLERDSMPTIAELAQPMLRLAGVRINPRTNGPYRTTNGPSTRYRKLTLKTIADGAERPVTLPPSPAISWIGYSVDGRRFAFTQTRDTGIELWVADTTTGQARALTDAQLNFALGLPPCSWVGDGSSLLCAFTVTDRGPAPVMSAVPTGPNIQESRGRSAATATYEDMLASAHDEALFEYYATSQLATVDATTGQRTPIGRPGIFDTFRMSPDGRFALVARVKRPFSWHVPYDDFPTSVEVSGSHRDNRQDHRGPSGRRCGAARGRPAGPSRLAVEPHAARDPRVGRSARWRRSEEQGHAARPDPHPRRAIRRGARGNRARRLASAERDVDLHRRRLDQRERSRHANGTHVGD